MKLYQLVPILNGDGSTKVRRDYMGDFPDIQDARKRLEENYYIETTELVPDEDCVWFTSKFEEIFELRTGG